MLTTEAGDKKYPGENDFVAVETPPQMKAEVTPVYPETARANAIEGVVWIRALVDENGKVIEAKVAKNSGKNCGFEEAALEAAKKCEYAPAISSGKPVAVWITYKVKFSLSEPPGK